MRDLLGVDLEYTRDFPPDGISADGMRNNGSALQMNAIQMEYYLAAAREALDKMITTERHRRCLTRFEKHGQQVSARHWGAMSWAKEFIVRIRKVTRAGTVPHPDGRAGGVARGERAGAGCMCGWGIGRIRWWTWRRWRSGT